VITAPAPLGAEHDLQNFDYGRPGLNDWLQKKAAKAQRVGGSARTYVVCSPEGRVVGYYALATGSVNREDAPGKIKKNMPDPIPVILIGRLAVDHSFKGKGLGYGLLKDALLRIVAAAEEIGVRAVLVHALDEQARNFYLHHGFYESPTNDLTLMVAVEEIQRTLGSSSAQRHIP
jgi:GNAT superfamily N-acetyltransferase